MSSERKIVSVSNRYPPSPIDGSVTFTEINYVNEQITTTITQTDTSYESTVTTLEHAPVMTVTVSAPDEYNMVSERIQNASRRSVDWTRPRPRTETCR